MKEKDKEFVYHIYSHADADGGIASALFGRFLRILADDEHLPIAIHPVNHGPDQQEWSKTDLKYPCAILDFSLHPAFLMDKFFISGEMKSRAEKKLPCFWIDHHPTGGGMSFLTPENCQTFLTHARARWDVEAISTPGLLRTHHESLGIPRSLIQEYEVLIDLAEIIDGALFANAQSAHDFSSDAVKLQTLFSSNHPLIDQMSIYRAIVEQLMKAPSVDDLLLSDPIYSALIEHEQSIVLKQQRIYQEQTRIDGCVAVSDFFEWTNRESFPGMGRFIPYLLFPDIQFAIHVQPPKNGIASVSCGINPWNKPSSDSKHLGRYFATHFAGGGHAFVAGGRITSRETQKINDLINFLKN
jgi:hypothetical protein